MVMQRRLVRYTTVGFGNTLCHWLMFSLLHLVWGQPQVTSNFIAFIVAASLSYRVNAHYTFAVRPSRLRYVLFLVGMGGLSLGVGALADHIRLSPWFTLVTFSVVSLVLGYGYSHAVVFKRRAP